jgi:NhaP-type Na+/H+ or K+/H+ antiporter
MELFIIAGGVAFGLVIGWVTYGFLRRNDRKTLTDITTIIGAIGGAAVTGIFQPATGAFAGYCVGLALGFFGYLVFYIKNEDTAPEWLGEAPGGTRVAICRAHRGIMTQISIWKSARP